MKYFTAFCLLFLLASFEANSQTTAYELRWDGSTPYLDFSNDALTDYDARIILTGENALYFDGTSVGINTSSPGGMLHVRDGGFWSSHNYGASVVVDGTHHNAIGIFDHSNANPVALANVYGALTVAKMPALGNTTTSPVHLITFAPGGAVQIGELNNGLDKRLRVPGTYNFEAMNLAMGSNGNGELEFVTHSSSSHSGGVKLYNADGANLHFQTAAPVAALGSLSYSTKMLLTNDGRVGIGTDAPGTFKLAVEGKIGAREVIVTGTSPWPDYVFADEYKLPSLETVKRYIAINKHLPDVPTASDVAEKGVDLGAMNALLLKKVEELTLYLIQVEEKNKKLEEAIAEINQLIKKK